MGLLELSRGQRVEASLPPKPPVYQPLGSWSLFSTSLVLEKDWFEITGIVQLMLLFPLKKKKEVCRGPVVRSVWTETPYW